MVNEHATIMMCVITMLSHCYSIQQCVMKFFLRNNVATIVFHGQIFHFIFPYSFLFIFTYHETASSDHIFILKLVSIKL